MGYKHGVQMRKTEGFHIETCLQYWVTFNDLVFRKEKPLNETNTTQYRLLPLNNESKCFIFFNFRRPTKLLPRYYRTGTDTAIFRVSELKSVHIASDGCNNLTLRYVMAHSGDSSQYGRKFEAPWSAT